MANLNSIKNFIPNKIAKKKKFLFVLLIVILVFLIATFLIWHFFIWHFFRVPKKKPVITPSPPSEPTQEEIFRKQMEELRRLREGVPPLTEKQLQAQIKELNRLRAGTKPLSEEQLQKQIEELKRLRGQ